MTVQKPINLGDRITFRSPTRWGYRKATRVVIGFHHGAPLVRFCGWSPFFVSHDEVLSVAPAQQVVAS